MRQDHIPPSHKEKKQYAYYSGRLIFGAGKVKVVDEGRGEGAQKIKQIDDMETK